jgi:hypothetical protein
VTAPTPGLDVAGLRRLVDEMDRLGRGHRWAALGLSFARQGPAILAALAELEELRAEVRDMPCVVHVEGMGHGWLQFGHGAPVMRDAGTFPRITDILAAREAEEVER